jgi:arylsulfatase A-like enzyme
MTRFLTIASTILTLALTALPDAWAGPASKRPNIILIVSDDQRPDTIHALGNPIIHTPHLDKLVKLGTAFTKAHSPHPICVPSRAEILTGTRGFTNGVLLPGGKLDGNLPTLAEVLRTAGYHTWYVGKWHTTGRPSTHGYSDTRGLYAGGGGKYWKDPVDYKGMPVTGYRGWVFQDDAGKIEPEKGVGLTPDISEKFADAAIEFIDSKPDKPFFLHVNFTAPHDPLYYPTRFKDQYVPDKMPLPPNFLPKHPFDHGNYEGRDEKMLPWPRTPDAVRKNLAVYYAVISHLDEQVGRIVAALEKSGQLENTIIIFTSDHGLATGSHGLMGKQNMYAHTVVVPLICAGPGVPQGQQREALVYLRDLYPTICDMAGAKIPATVEAKSLLPVIEGKQKEVYKQLFCYFSDSQRMIRDHEWKLIHYPKIGRYQLFDLVNDPHEMKDLAASPQHQPRVQAMREQLLAWQKSVRDPILPK